MNNYFTVLTLVVHHPCKSPPRRIAKLVERLIQSGLEEANASDLEEFLDGDVRLAQSLDIRTPLPVIGGRNG